MDDTRDANTSHTSVPEAKIHVILTMWPRMILTTEQPNTSADSTLVCRPRRMLWKATTAWSEERQIRPKTRTNRTLEFRSVNTVFLVERSVSVVWVADRHGAANKVIATVCDSTATKLKL